MYVQFLFCDISKNKEIKKVVEYSFCILFFVFFLISFLYVLCVV